MERDVTLLEYGDVEVEPQWQIAQQQPVFCRVYWIHRDSAVYTEGATETKLRRGYIYVLPCAASYAVRHNPVSPLVCTFLHFNIAPLLLRRLVALECTAHPQETALFAAVRAAIAAGNRDLVEKLAALLIGLLLRQRAFERANDAVYCSVQYIHQHLDTPVTLPVLAQLSGYQPQYFARMFKCHMGLAPCQYIRQCRMKLATALLHGRLPLEQIACRTGYSDAKIFSKAFRQYYGMPPTVYQKMKKLTP